MEGKVRELQAKKRRFSMAGANVWNDIIILKITFQSTKFRQNRPTLRDSRCDGFDHNQPNVLNEETGVIYSKLRWALHKMPG